MERNRKKEKKKEESRETQRERERYIQPPPRNRGFFLHVALAHTRFSFVFSTRFFFHDLHLCHFFTWSVFFVTLRKWQHPRVNHPLTRSWSSFSLNRHILAHRYVSFQIFSRLDTSRREQRPSFRCKKLHNYTFERPPGRWGLRENHQPIPIYTQIPHDCAPYRPPPVTVNDRLTFFTVPLHSLDISAAICFRFR